MTQVDKNVLGLKQWVAKLAALKQRAMDGHITHHLSIQDIRDKSQDPQYMGPMYPTSPKSIEAYQTLGIDPLQLKSKPLDVYLAKYPSRPDLANIEYQHHLARRENAFTRLIAERARLEHLKDSSISFGSSKMVQSARLDEMMKKMEEKELERLRKLKHQRQKEIELAERIELSRLNNQKQFEQKLRLLEEKQRSKAAERRLQQIEKKKALLKKQMVQMEKEKRKDLETREALEKKSKQDAIRKHKENMEEQERKKLREKLEKERNTKIQAIKMKHDAFKKIFEDQQQERQRKLQEREDRLEMKKRQRQLQLEQERLHRQKAARERLRYIKSKLQKSRLARERLYKEREARLAMREQKQHQASLAQEKERKEQERRKFLAKQLAHSKKLKEERNKQALFEKKSQEMATKIATKLSLQVMERERQALIHKLQMQDKMLSVAERQRKEAYDQEMRSVKLEKQEQRATLLLEKRQELQKARKLANQRALIQRSQLALK